ncbi:hypothetical protein LCGC14_1053700, partial [marine sediment metagenome]
MSKIGVVVASSEIGIPFLQLCLTSLDMSFAETPHEYTAFVYECNWHLEGICSEHPLITGWKKSNIDLHLKHIKIQIRDASAIDINKSDSILPDIIVYNDFAKNEMSQFDYDIFIVARSIYQVQQYVNTIDIKNVSAFIIDETNDSTERDLQIRLIGLYSAFKELNDLGFKKSLVLSCDIPLINKKVVNYLIDCSKKFECCIPQW